MDQSSSVNLEEDEENIRTPENSQSQVLSDQSNSPGARKKFRKFDWLNQHFDIIGEQVSCRHCKKMYKNRHAPRLISHIKTCRKGESVEELDAISDIGSNREVNNLMVMSFVASNIPLSYVETSEFKLWMSKLRETLHWVPPSRRDLSSVSIPRLSRKLHQEFLAATLNMSAPSLSIEFDHWQDANTRSLLGVIATTPVGKRHLLDLRDTSERGHSANVIVEDLVDILGQLPSQAINSIVSDSASSCKKARLDLIKLENYSHIIQHRCMAHLMNRIGQRITTKNAEIAETLATATKITSLISSSPLWQAALQQLDHHKLKPACPTRWYSIVNMGEGLITVKAVILETILPRVAEDKARMIRSLDWKKLEAILEVLRPINKCIGLVEAADVSLGQAFGSILNYAKELFAPGTCSEFKSSARAAFLWHFSQKRIDKKEFGLYIAAYVLDRRHKLNYITQDGSYLALETMALIVRSSAPIQRIKSSLIDEFEAYRKLREDYALEDVENNSIRWWSKRPLSILRQVATRLAHLKASSTNIERTFSTLRQIQGGSRMNLSMSLLVDIGRLKISQGVIYGSDEDAFDLTSYNLDEQQQSGTSSKRQCIETDDVQQAAQGDELDSSDIIDWLEMTDWLETQDLETVGSYKWFFKHVNFSITFGQADPIGSQSQTASEEQIRQLIQQARDSQNYGVVIDSASQSVQFDGEFANANFLGSQGLIP